MINIKLKDVKYQIELDDLLISTLRKCKQLVTFWQKKTIFF